jgi:uncharacterized membrane protein YccC
VITHFEATVTLLGVVIGMLGALVTSVWKARGWIDRLNQTDSGLARAIEDLSRTQRELHQANQERFLAIESRLGPPRGRRS